MDASEFTPSAPGKLIKSPEGHVAFVPDPLPPHIELDTKTISALSEAARSLGTLGGIGQMLPNPHLLIGPFVRREAVLSSRIEGTIADLGQLWLFEASPAQADYSHDVQEVANYVRALEYGLERLKELPISLRLIRELHQRLMTGVRGRERNPGEFRKNQNYIASRGQTIEDARFVPPPVKEMTQCLHDFERFLHADNELPFLVQMAIIHYQFETIHPFEDGNGRIGRLLIPLILCERRELLQPLLYLSAFFEKNRDAYMDHLLRVSQEGAWLEWVRFFLQGVSEQASDAVMRSKKLMELWQSYRSMFQKVRNSALQLRLIDFLFSSPVITTSHTAKVLGVTYTSAQRHIERLQSAGILQEMTGQQRNRMYYATEIFELLSPEGS